MKINNSNFVHIHNHTEFSSFDGLNKISTFPLTARKMGFKALGITDHGNVGGLIKFFQECTRTSDKNGNKITEDPFLNIATAETVITFENAILGNPRYTAAVLSKQEQETYNYET